MTERAPATPSDIGEYCRRVEDHLTRANAGHLVRIVGPGFELVRRWAETGVPLSIVYRGIDLKAERHREGASKRPLRLEFCADDVRAVFEQWRRAVGVGVVPAIEASDAEEPAGGETGGPNGVGEPEAADPRRRSLGRHLDRAIDRLSRALGRVDTPEGLRQAGDAILQALAELRASTPRARGAVRDDAIAALARLDVELTQALQQHMPESWVQHAHEDARIDLAPFRARLDEAAWQRSLDVTVDRLLRDRLGLPVLAL